MPVATGRVLLVSPDFHAIHASIEAALTERGWSVSVHPYDRFDTARRKVLNKGIEVVDRLGVRRSPMRGDLTSRAVRAVRQARPDVVLTIKGDVLGDDYWQAVEAVGARHALWLYDALDRMHHTDHTLTRMTGVASFSATDAARMAERGIQSVHLPLAFDAWRPAVTRRIPDVVFAGARYPNREQLLVALGAAGLPLRAYGRTWSRRPFDRLRTLDLRRPDVPSSPELPRDEALDEVGAARVALNVHSHGQDGFTLRTFEAAGVGGLQLIDRPDVDTLYDVGTETLVFGSAEEVVEAWHRATRDPAWSEGIRSRARARTLAEHTFDHRVAVLEQLWA